MCGVCLMNTMKEMMGLFIVSDIEVHVWCVSHEYEMMGIFIVSDNNKTLLVYI